MNCNLSLLSNFIEEYEELLIGKRTDFSQYFLKAVYARKIWWSNASATPARNC